MTYVASAAMLAFVIDGEVVQVMGTDERLAAGNINNNWIAKKDGG